MTEHQGLFCPFCREPFEGRASCPDHTLALVPFDQLALAESDADDTEEREIHPDERPIALLDPRWGRGVVALGALLAGAALALDLAPLGGRVFRAYQVAAALPSLWTLLLASFSALYVLFRRRTPRELRALRVLVPLLGGVVMLTLALALRRLGTAVFTGSAAYAMVASAVALVWGGVRLGGPGRAAHQ